MEVKLKSLKWEGCQWVPGPQQGGGSCSYWDPWEESITGWCFQPWGNTLQLVMGTQRKTKKLGPGPKHLCRDYRPLLNSCRWDKRTPRKGQDIFLLLPDFQNTSLDGPLHMHLTDTRETPWGRAWTPTSQSKVQKGGFWTWQIATLTGTDS